MSEVFHRQIEPQRVDPHRAARSAGFEAAGLRKMYEWSDERVLMGNSLTLRTVLGRESKTLSSYFIKLAAQAPT